MVIDVVDAIEAIEAVDLPGDYSTASSAAGRAIARFTHRFRRHLSVGMAGYDGDDSRMTTADDAVVDTAWCC